MGVSVLVGDAGTSHPGPYCVPVSVPEGSGLAQGLVYSVQHKGCSSLGVELVARPIPGGPPAYLPWADRPELSLCGSPGVEAGTVAQSQRPPRSAAGAVQALCGPGHIAVLQHHLVLWDGEAQHPNTRPGSYGSTVGTGQDQPARKPKQAVGGEDGQIAQRVPWPGAARTHPCPLAPCSMLGNFLRGSQEASRHADVPAS